MISSRIDRQRIEMDGNSASGAGPDANTHSSLFDLTMFFSFSGGLLSAE